MQPSYHAAPEKPEKATKKPHIQDKGRKSHIEKKDRGNETANTPKEDRKKNN